MAQAKTSKTNRRKPATRRASSAKKAGDDPLERLRGSLDAAEAALKDLRSGAGKGTKQLVRDLEQAVKHLRKNARDVSRAVAKDLAAAGTPARKPSARKKTSSTKARGRPASRRSK